MLRVCDACFIHSPGVKLEDTVVLQRSQHLHLLQHPRALTLIYTLDGVVLNAFFTSPFVHHAVLASTYGVVNVIAIHDRMKLNAQLLLCNLCVSRSLTCYVTMCASPRPQLSYKYYPPAA